MYSNILSSLVIYLTVLRFPSAVLFQEIVGKLAALEETDAPPSDIKPCSLDKSTQALVKLIFNNDMFKEAMQSMEIGKIKNTVLVLS